MRAPATLVLTHAAGAAGGAVAWSVGFPLPWLIGALVVVAAITLSGVPSTANRTLRDGAVLLLLTGIGLTFTPEAGSTTLRLLPLILGGAVATVAIGCAASLLLARIGGIDRATSFFCSVPGGPAEMSMLGAQQGASMPPIAISQLLRIVTLVLVIPPTLSVLGVRGDFSTSFPSLGFDAAGFVATIALSLALALVLRRLGLTSAFLVGPLAVGIGLGLSGLELSVVPRQLMMAAQVFMGAYLGAQFQPDILRSMRRFLPASLMNVCLVTCGCAGLGFLLHFLDREAVPTMILATAPGSVTEMSITAQALGFNVPVVTAFHVVRIMVVIMMVGPTFQLMRAAGLVPPAAPSIHRNAEPAE